MLWVQFAICLTLIVISGSRLTVYADEISDKTGLSKGLMGVLILAFITSCPELATTLSSITVINAPDLAIGDLLGADAFNIFAIALLGVICGKGSIMRGQSKVNIFTAALTVLMLLVVIGSVALRRFTNLSLEISNMGFGSILIGLIYIGGMGVIYRQEAHVPKSNISNIRKVLTIKLFLKFIISAVIIVISGVWLASIGKNISIVYRLNEMYVGVLLIAFATTMPEFVVSLTALKQNSISMATGNLLGSNIFNLFIIFILDISLSRGNFFSYVSDLNIYPAFFGIILSVIAIGTMIKKPTKRKILKFFSWDSIIIIATFIVGHILLFNLAKEYKP